MAAGTSIPAVSAAGVLFVPLLGVHSRQPLSFLLELGGFTFLLDCGWSDAYDPQLLQPIVDVLPHVDAGQQCAVGGCIHRMLLQLLLLAAEQAVS
jgi:hypothetical protein